jgi:hypothetical protein
LAQMGNEGFHCDSSYGSRWPSLLGSRSRVLPTDLCLK